MMMMKMKMEMAISTTRRRLERMIAARKKAAAETKGEGAEGPEMQRYLCKAKLKQCRTVALALVVSTSSRILLA